MPVLNKSIRRKPNLFLFWLSTFVLTSITTAQAQQPVKVSRIGFLVSGSASAYTNRIDAFRTGLRERGYLEGKSILIEYRYSQAKPYLLPELAAALVRLQVSTIVAATGDAARAAAFATQTTPIVFVTVAIDPVEGGLVSSLARPGGNVTGLTILAPELDGKRLDLLKEAFPDVTRIAFLGGKPLLWEAGVAAERMRLRLQWLGATGADDLGSAFKAAKSAGAQALLASPSIFLIRHCTRIIDLAAKNRLQAIYPTTDYAEAGGLMSYGPDISDNFRRAAVYVDKILKGARPADLPVEQPTKFELAVNLKTAKQIGLTIPPNVLARADRVIR
jgi:putative ABC transport system substrate-binding protein